MPMKSVAQRGFLHANLPEVAERFEKETPKGAKLPQRVGKKTTAKKKTAKKKTSKKKSTKRR